jgi:hypothetical protein
VGEEAAGWVRIVEAIIKTEIETHGAVLYAVLMLLS